MKNLTEKQLLIISVAVNVVIAIGVLWGIYTKYQQHTGLQTEIDDLVAQENSLRTKKVEKLDQIKKDVEVLREEQNNVLNFRLPALETKEASKQELFEIVQQYIQESNISISEATHLFEDEKKKKGRKKKKAAVRNFEEVGYAYQLWARFEDIVMFINMLENNDRLLNVVALSIDASKGGSGGYYPMGVGFIAYVFKPPVKKKKAGAKK
ncbi:hypothetical protein ACFL54_03780 [Planctomycetota bacterium]